MGRCQFVKYVSTTIPSPGAKRAMLWVLTNDAAATSC